MASKPKESAAFRPIGFWEFGVARNGVPLDPGGPHFRGDASTGWRFEVLSPVARPKLGIDAWLAHSQPGGAYHYHGLSIALLGDSLLAEKRSMKLLGWAADGFPVYAPWAPSDPNDPSSPSIPLQPSYRLKGGSRGSGPRGAHDGTFVEDHEFVAGLGDLDEANGRRGVTPEFPEGTYHYFMTAGFPFIPRFFRGTPDPTFGLHKAGPGLSGVPPALRSYGA
ncbi:YHYH protein [bacterium]|nr:YHYH protein [bacterium]